MPIIQSLEHSGLENLRYQNQIEPFLSLKYKGLQFDVSLQALLNFFAAGDSKQEDFAIKKIKAAISKE